jgi:hypothetical protein
VSLTAVELRCQLFNFKGDSGELLKVIQQPYLQVALTAGGAVVFTVIDHHTFIRVEADRKFTGTTATGFFNAPDAAIAGQVVFRLEMPQVPNLAYVVRNGGGAPGFAQLVCVVQNQERAAVGVGNIPQVIDAGAIVGVFLVQFAGPVSGSEEGTDLYSGSHLYDAQ